MTDAPTTTKTDETLLREAATRVRVVGEKATKGVCPHWTWSAIRHVARNVDLECAKHDTDGELDEDCASWGMYDDSPWFALVDARLTEPLAAWLESAADDAGQIGPDHRAVAVARTLLAAELPS